MSGIDPAGLPVLQQIFHPSDFTPESDVAFVHALKAALLAKALPLSAEDAIGSGPDDADAGRFSTLQDWQIAGLRRTVAELIVDSRR